MSSRRPPDRQRLDRRSLLHLGLQGAGALALPSTLAAAPLSDPLPARGQLISRIAFGSCLKRPDDGAVLSRIADRKPDVMLWLGDNIYADTTDPAVMRDKYAVLAQNPHFQRLASQCPNLATWDDHDYGMDNVGGDFPMKQASRDLFFDFWKIDARSARRKHEGIYDAVIAGPRGKEVQILLLDGRYNRSRKGDPQGTLLGAAQWRWLDAQLARRAAVRVFVSGIQVVNTENPGPERWVDFPHERQRLFDLIRRRRASGAIFLSGDTHRAELNIDRGALGYDAVDLTSSSLDHPIRSRPRRSRHLVGDAYVEANFGVVEIDWYSPDPVIKLEIHPAAGGPPAISHWLRLSGLHPARVAAL